MSFYALSIFSAKSAIVLVFLTIAYRFLGKRDLGQFNVYDLVTVIALSNAVQNSMTAGRGELGVGITSATTLLAVGYLFARLYVRKPIAQRIAFGVPVVLISEGHLDVEKLSHEHVSVEELDAVIREHGLDSKSSVALAVLEIDGSISIVPKDADQVIDEKLD